MKLRQLRGHHLLCVHGFQGMGYSPAFVAKMGEIVKEIRDRGVDISIKIMIGFDETCQCCPNKGETACEADENSDAHVRDMDKKVLRHLKLKENGIYPKEWLVERTAAMVAPDDLDFLCKDCSWLDSGVCKEGLIKLKQRLLK